MCLVSNGETLMLGCWWNFVALDLMMGESSKSRPFSFVGLGILFHFFLGKVGASMSLSLLGKTCHIFFIDFVLSLFVETCFASIL